MMIEKLYFIIQASVHGANMREGFAVTCGEIQLFFFLVVDSNKVDCLSLTISDHPEQEYVTC